VLTECGLEPSNEIDGQLPKAPRLGVLDAVLTFGVVSLYCASFVVGLVCVVGRVGGVVVDSVFVVDHNSASSLAVNAAVL
jgi:hypothetical protein